SNGTTLTSNQHAAVPGQVVKFDIKLFGPTNVPARVYREFFQPVVEGGSPMNDPSTFLDVTIQ
ncbi:MAG TPA: hypothetical protein VMR98_03590, partial [Candidatus Polarisedimenticolaceae bacterium]|nr:hypothetical protein [Candidatus Polarisedimenticolaceae bacterium]